MCYVFLGLVITPIVATFLAQIPIPPRQAASPSSFEGPANPSVLPSSSEDSSEEPGDSSAADSRTCRSSAHAAIVSMFTGQYVVGLAYVVTTFIKHKEMTYYHLRIVIGLCSINFVVLFVCEYTRKTIPGMW